MKVEDFVKEIAQTRVRVEEEIKLVITKLFKNHSDLANELCLIELPTCGENPLYEKETDEYNATFIEDIRVVDNELEFTFSSGYTDLQEGKGSELSIDQLLTILELIQNLTEDDIKFE